MVSKGLKGKLEFLIGDIDVFEYSQIPNDVYFEKSSHEKKFRSNFWRTSIERLIAISDFHADYPDESILHIESDVLLFPNFPFEIFEKSTKLVWQNYNIERDVASLVYSPNYSKSNWLKSQIVRLINSESGTTDMTALSKIRKANSNEILLLPSLPIGSTGALNLASPGFAEGNHSFLDAPNGLFDSAQFGMWLFGMDPRNHYGIKILHSLINVENGEAPFDPRRINFKKSEPGTIKIQLNDLSMPVFSLHVHSKEVLLFNFDNDEVISEYVELSSFKDEIRKFDVKEFLKLLLVSLLTNRLPQFVLGFPYIYKRYIKFRQVLRKHLKR
jgi:hypothetical protein